MDAAPEKLLEALEELEADLEVERQPGQHEPPASTSCATLNTPATGLWRGWISVATTGVINLNVQTHLRQYRHPLPMLAERELRPRRAPVKYQESDDDDDDAPHDDDDDAADDDDDADDPELTDLRATQAHNTTQRARWAEASRRYRATHRAQRAEAQKRYRARHRERVAEAQKRYREQHRDRITEKYKRYWKANREWLMERQQRYRESHREELREKQRQRDARRRELLREQNRIRRARFRAKKRMKKLMALGPLTLTIPLVREAHPELLREKMRTREKLKALDP